MPTYLDRHFAEGATQQAITLAHEKDLAVQDKYGVKFITYWFDEDRCTSFCLVEAANQQAVIDTHADAHGMVPHEIIEVDPSIVETFLGRIQDPTPTNPTQYLYMDSAFRAIMFTDLKDSTLMTTLFGDKKALHLLHIHNAITRHAIRTYHGREIKHTGDGFMVSFTSIAEQVRCAMAIQRAFQQHNQTQQSHELLVRIGLSAGEPIEEHGDLFGSAVQMAARLCSLAQPEQILTSQVVQAQCEDASIVFMAMDSARLKGFAQATPVYQAICT